MLYKIKPYCFGGMTLNTHNSNVHKMEKSFNLVSKPNVDNE